MLTKNVSHILRQVIRNAQQIQPEIVDVPLDVDPLSGESRSEIVVDEVVQEDDAVGGVGGGGAEVVFCAVLVAFKGNNIEIISMKDFI